MASVCLASLQPLKDPLAALKLETDFDLIRLDVRRISSPATDGLNNLSAAEHSTPSELPLSMSLI